LEGVGRPDVAVRVGRTAGRPGGEVEAGEAAGEGARAGAGCRRVRLRRRRGRLDRARDRSLGEGRNEVVALPGAWLDALLAVGLPELRQAADAAAADPRRAGRPVADRPPLRP